MLVRPRLTRGSDCATSGDRTLVRPPELRPGPNTPAGKVGPGWVASHQTRLKPIEPAPVDAERGSGHEGGIIRGQKGNRCRNVLGLAHHARVDLLGARLHVRVIPQHGRVDRAW